jgi:hypothetical protein
VFRSLFDPLGERIVYLTKYLVDEGRKVGGLNGRPYIRSEDAHSSPV